MKPLIQHELFETPADKGGGIESEVEQDLEMLNSDKVGGDDDDESETDNSGDEDGGDAADEDMSASKRGRGGPKEDSEDTEDEEDAEEADEESELGDIDDEEETDEDKEEEKQPAYARPPIKAIKDKYPNFFKDFPQLKAAFFGYSQFTEVFADVDSAREAAGKAQEYDNLEATLVNRADPKFLLETLNENNPKALKKMIGNLPETLRKVDQDAYFSLSTPIIEELLYHAAAHGSKVGNKNLQLAARHIANFVFANGGEIPDISKKTTQSEPTEAEKELQAERESYAKEKFQGALSDVHDLIKPEINSIIANKLDGLTGFEKRQIVKEARAEVDRILSADKAFSQTMRNLWKKASESGYSSESKSRIKRAWLDRAKLVAPSVRNRLKQEALSSRNGSKKDKPQDKEGGEGKIKFKVSSQKRSFPERGGKVPQTSHRRVLDPKKIDWRKTSDRDILDM
jgi:hypothetical protein